MRGVLLDPGTGRPVPDMERLVPPELAESLRRSRLLPGPTMMADFPMFDGQTYVTSLSRPGLGDDLCSTGATVNVKGAWTQIIASLSHGANGILISMAPGAGGCQSFLSDVGVGAAGSEQVLVPNLLYSQGPAGAANSAFGSAVYYIPVQVAAGSRISIRGQCNVASKSYDGVVTLMCGGMLSPSMLSRVTAYGANTGTSRGTFLDPGGTSGAWGSWTQLAASTSAPIRQLILSCGWGSSWSDATGQWWTVDLGIGAAGSEQVVLSGFQFRRYDNNQSKMTPQPHVYPPVPISIPAGVRLSARAAPWVAQATATNREIEVIAYGVD